MLSNFIRCADEIVQYDAYFRLLSIDEHIFYSLDVEKTELISLWTPFKEEYDNLMRRKVIPVVDSDEEKTPTPGSDIASAKIKYREIYKVYVNCLAYINEMLDMKKQCQQKEGKSNDKSSTRSDCTLPLGSQPHIQLPPCDTEDFHGDYVMWPSFRDMFTALYINNPRLSNVVKLYHLRQKTRGEARDIVVSAPLTNDGFQLAWDNLIDRYENKRILINSQLKVMFNLPHITKESGADIKSLQRTLNGCINTLKILDINVNGWDPIFIFLCSTHLPNSTLDLWEQSIENKADVPLWKDLDGFLSNRYQTLESMSDIKDETLPSAKGHTKPATCSKSNNKPQLKSLHVEINKANCLLCKQNHSIRLCPSFLQLSVENRHSTVKKLKLCFNCLASSHDLKKCKSKFSCSTCKHRHHSLLHRPPQNSPNNMVDIHPSTSKPSAIGESVINNNSPLGQYTTQSYTAQLGLNLSDQVVLGTAQVHICVGDSIYTARALIDSGSEASFVSERVQQTLRLFTRKVYTQITGLNEVVAAQSTKMCTLKIRSLIDAQFEIETDAYVVRELTAQIYHPLKASFMDCL